MQFLHRVLHAAAGVQAGLQVVVVELHREGLQVQVLLVAQVGHGELAHAVEVVHVAAGGELAVVGLHRLLRQEVVGDVLDVVAVVGDLGPFGVAGLEALGAQVGGRGQGADLHARIVVIELAVHLPALGGVEAADGVAQRRLATMAHVQRAGGVGRHELDHQGWPLAGAKPKRSPASAPLCTICCLASGLRRMLMKPGPRCRSRTPIADTAAGQQRRAQLLPPPGGG